VVESILGMMINLFISTGNEDKKEFKDKLLIQDRDNKALKVSLATSDTLTLYPIKSIYPIGFMEKRDWYTFARILS
jgi:hypothetical protein